MVVLATIIADILINSTYFRDNSTGGWSGAGNANVAVFLAVGKKLTVFSNSTFSEDSSPQYCSWATGIVHNSSVIYFAGSEQEENELIFTIYSHI